MKTYNNHLNLPWQITFRSATGTKGTITYIYDATGTKLKKTTLDTSGNTETTTTYIGPFQYQAAAPLTGAGSGILIDTLKFFAQPEGRVRVEPDTTGGQSLVSFKYDYFLKDHLGDTRMVLTDEQQTDMYPAATMEVGDSATENLYYSNLDSTRSTLPAGYPTDTTTNPNTYVAKLSANGSAPVIGPGIILKVMAGDQFSVRVSSWYRLNGSAPGAPISPATDILSHLISGMAGLPTAENPGLSALQANSSALSADVLNFLQDTGTAINSSRPHAFVNWILLDNQFNYVAASSGFSQVGNDQELHVTTLTNVPITSNGYLYIYTSNEDPIVNVYFDNLQVTHTRGPLLEEDHYYPGGLTMAGISDKALKSNYAENKYRYNGKELQHQEFSDGSGLEEYDYGARFQDPQLGVWHSIDPKANDFATMSPYAQMNDNPIRYKDPTGKSADDWVKKKNTGQYEWKNNVTSAASTPKGYTYVGHDDNSIIKDLGWNSNMAPQSKTTIGYVAADDENEGPVTYSASDIIKVKAETSITVNAVVDTKYDLGKGDISKTFIGVSIGITNISKTTSGMDITAPATASLNFNGQQYTKALGDLPSNEAHVSATGSQVTAGNIMIPAAQINSGAKFPTVTVSGYWTHQTEGGSQTPVVNHPLYPTVKTFNFTFGQ